MATNYSQKGTVALAYPIERISRKLALRSEKIGKNINVYAVISTLSTPTKDMKPHDRHFFGMRKHARSTAPTDDERLNRIRFAAVSRAVALRMKNLTTISADQAAFIAQRDSANGIKSFKGYIWDLECASYDSAHPQGWSEPHTSPNPSTGGNSGGSGNDNYGSADHEYHNGGGR